MKMMKHADGHKFLRLSKAEVKQLTKKAGWQDDFAYLEEDEENWADLDVTDVDIDDVLSEIEDEELQKQLSDVHEDEGGDSIAKSEEAMAILSPILEDLAGGEWLDPESVINDMVDAVSPLMEDLDLDLSNPIATLREYLTMPDRPEDTELKRGIRQIMKMTGIPEEEPVAPVEAVPAPETPQVETPRIASAKKYPLGFSQSSDLWYKILGKKK